MIVAVVQARTGATRLPGKVLYPFAGSTLLERVMYATEKAADRDWRLVLATTVLPDDDVIAEYGRGDWDVWRGAVCPMDRFIQVANAYELRDRDILVRLTCDDPFKVPALMRVAVDALVEFQGDPQFYKVDTNHGQYSGLGAEAFTVSALRWASSVTKPDEREHVTTVLRPLPLAPVTFSVDTPEDLKRWERYAA